MRYLTFLFLDQPLLGQNSAKLEQVLGWAPGLTIATAPAISKELNPSIMMVGCWDGTGTESGDVLGERNRSLLSSPFTSGGTGRLSPKGIVSLSGLQHGLQHK